MTFFRDFQYKRHCYQLKIIKEDKNMGVFNTAHTYYGKFHKLGVWDEEMAEAKIGEYYTEERKEYIHKFYDCLLNNCKLNELARLYITEGRAVRATVEKYNEKVTDKKKVNDNTGKTRIIYCANKINNIFSNGNVYYKDSYTTVEEDKKNKKKGTDAIEWIIEADQISVDNNKVELLKECEKEIDNFINSFNYQKDCQNQLIINIPSVAKVENISEDKFDDFIEMITPYSKKVIARTQEIMNEMREEAGYYKYLMTPGVKLTETDRERRDQIISLLGLEEDVKTEITNEDVMNQEIVL